VIVVGEIDYVQFTDDLDGALADDLADLPQDVTFGGRRFPSPGQYQRRVADFDQAGGRTSEGNRLYAVAQREWHTRGQTGCVFARLAARGASSLRWDYIVADEISSGSGLYRGIGDKISQAISDEECQVVSVLFPHVTLPREAVHAIYGLAAWTPLWLERNITRKSNLHIHARYPVATRGVQAWIMAFAPFPFMPNTRRGPFFELAIRVKGKPEQIFHRLNQDRDLAHLADVPLQMPEKHQEDRWRSTMRRTRMILDREPDEVTAAKSTIVIPLTAMWRYTGLHGNR
jgi:hypothetical protein